MPLYCAFTSSGRLVAVFDNMICSFRENGELIKSHKLSDGARILLADVNEHGAAVIKQVNGENELVVFDQNGNLAYSGKITESAESIALFGKFVFIDGDNAIIRINFESQAISKVENLDFGAAMMVKNENEVLLCLSSRVKYIKFD